MQVGGGLRADRTGPPFWGRCARLSVRGAWAWSISLPGSADCLHQRGISCAELLELTCQMQAPTPITLTGLVRGIWYQNHSDG